MTLLSKNLDSMRTMAAPDPLLSLLDRVPAPLRGPALVNCEAIRRHLELAHTLTVKVLQSADGEPGWRSGTISCADCRRPLVSASWQERPEPAPRPGPALPARRLDPLSRR